MPEGDTIHRTATRLRPALEGATLVRFEARRAAPPWPARGTSITAVEAVGKHLLVRFGDGRTLQTHLGMTGSWHLYRTGERWQRPAHLVRAVVEVEGWTAVCFAAPTVRVLQGPTATAAATAHLGPDLCAVGEDDRRAVVDAAADRIPLVVQPGVDIADVLLDQRVAAGIGNVYKSEVLWAHRVHPFTSWDRLDPAIHRTLLDTAVDQLQANLGGGPRRTVPGGLAVYGRARRPCRRCGTPVLARRSGPHARSTYWCPSCQPPDASPTRQDGGRRAAEEDRSDG